MKRVFLVLCCMAMLMSFSGCGILDMVKEDFLAVKEDGKSLENAFSNLGEEREEDVDQSMQEAAENQEVDTTVPEEPTADPALVEEALYLYRWFIDQALVPLDWDYTYYDTYPCDVSGTLAADLGYWAEPYAVTGIILSDLSADGIPEMILRAGEVEQEFFVYTARGGVVDCVGYGNLDNQNGTEELIRYRSSSGEYVTVSAGGAGSGAGNYGFYELIRQDLTVTGAPFHTMDEYDDSGYYTVYYVNDAAVSVEEYDAAVESFYADLTWVETLTFRSLGEDRYQAFDDEATEWNAR